MAREFVLRESLLFSAVNRVRDRRAKALAGRQRGRWVCEEEVRDVDELERGRCTREDSDSRSGRVNEFRQASDDAIGMPQPISGVRAGQGHDGHSRRPSSLHTRWCVFDHQTVSRQHPKTPGGCQKNHRIWLAQGHIFTTDHGFE